MSGDAHPAILDGFSPVVERTRLISRRSPIRKRFLARPEDSLRTGTPHSTITITGSARFVFKAKKAFQTRAKHRHFPPNPRTSEQLPVMGDIPSAPRSALLLGS